MHLYLDACIWRDYWENRSDRFRPLGEWAHRLIMKAIREEIPILISSFLITELQNHLPQDQIRQMIEIIPENLLLHLTPTREQDELARRLSRQRRVAYGDALHAIMARENGAIMVTRDRHFERLLDVVEVRKPEELI